MKKSLVAAAVGATFALGSTGHIEGTAVVLLPPETYNIVTVVGGGTDTGDGGLAVAAHLDVPSGVAFDSIGNMYVAETSTYMAPLPLHCITVSARSTRQQESLRRLPERESRAYTGEYQLATLANITAPIRVLFDHADNFYINGATGNNRIQKVDAATGLITTVVGHLNGEPCPASDPPPPCGDGGMATDAWVTGPLQGSTFDAAGNLYFSGSNRVRKITARVAVSPSRSTARRR